MESKKMSALLYASIQIFNWEGYIPDDTVLDIYNDLVASPRPVSREFAITCMIYNELSGRVTGEKSRHFKPMNAIDREEFAAQRVLQAELCN